MSNRPPPVGPDIPPGSGPPSGEQSPRASPPKRSRTAILIMAAIAVTVVAAAGVLMSVFAFNGSNAADTSPEGQIRSLMKNADNYLNNADAAGLASLLCDAQKNSPSVHVHTGDQLRKQRDVAGLETSSATDINVAGDQATATVSVTWSKAPQDDLTENVKFVRENGRWKVCGKADK